MRPPALRRCLRATVTLTGGAALSLLLGITVAEVVSRHVFATSLLGAEDLAMMCLSVFVAAGLVGAAEDGGHVSVDLIGRFVGPRVTRMTDWLARLLAIGATALAAFALFAKGRCGLGWGVWVPGT